VKLAPMSHEDLDRAVEYAHGPGDHQEIHFLDVPAVGQVIIHKRRFALNGGKMNLAHGALIEKHVRKLGVKIR